MIKSLGADVLVMTIIQSMVPGLRLVTKVGVFRGLGVQTGAADEEDDENNDDVVEKAVLEEICVGASVMVVNGGGVVDGSV